MSDAFIPLYALKGRGAASRLAHRFERDVRDAYDDGWGTLDETAADAWLPLQTEVRFENVKSVLSENDSPDIPFDRSLNPYRGCEHGCIYCFARPTHSYLNLSPGLDFETKLIAKRNVAEVLRAELGRKGYRPSQIAIGTATDCYQPIERELRLTRAVIEVLQETRHPFGLVTKSSAVEHDLDLIAPMAAEHLAAVYVTVTTLDGALARKLEPRAASPQRRLRTIRTLAEAGVPVGVSVAPQIPFITDDMEKVLEAAWEAGARCAFYTVVRLPWEVAPLFKQWLELHYPDRAARVMARIREMRGGKDYDADFATRMKGSGLWADLIRQRFEKATNRIGFNRQRIPLDLGAFRPPGAAGQGSLF
ncbi:MULTISPECIES: PA0069 family radical SAM protein [unclassified Variovorax]|uniref:PA0069 family radical SAM protein n=1 Tax=unclassified Variovorax TaxID=663243 RepID=UPI00257854E8|nr:MULTISPECIES: PA0069 family radical SAM protein [unclassified Variovorax]MDM0087486.1 PA0069 family radical SAM protein [Variovorax sp. J22G40]MDM0144257.1 PA0069 family radical SAM protein [Variovorax sp. J2P1-31]